MNRAFSPVQAVRDLTRRQTDEVTQDYHLALFVGEAGKGLPDKVRSIEICSSAGVRIEDRLRWREAIRAEVVYRHIPGEAKQPCKERDASFFVLPEPRHQLEKHVLGDIFGFLVIANDAADVPVNVVGIAPIQKAQCLVVSLLGACNREPRFFELLRRVVDGSAAMKTGSRA